MAPSGEGALMAFDELTVDVGLNHPAVRVDGGSDSGNYLIVSKKKYGTD